MLIATSARARTYRQLQTAVHWSYESFGPALRKHVKPMVQRLGWLKAGEEFNLHVLAGMLGERRPYMKAITSRLRPDLAHLYD